MMGENHARNKESPINSRTSFDSRGEMAIKAPFPDRIPANLGSDSSEDQGIDAVSDPRKSIEQGDSALPHTKMENQSNEQENLSQLRSTWKEMLKVVPQDGDASYLVPTSYLEKVLELKEASSISELAVIIGKVDCSSIVDEHGVLPEEVIESNSFTQISPELFHQLVSVLGLRGDPVIRNVIVEEDGTSSLEIYPPFFAVYALSDSSAPPKYYSSFDRSNQQFKCSFSLSQSKTFYNLIDAIKSCMFKAKNVDIRVWFVNSENLEDLPPTIPVSMFINDLQEKKLIGPSIMEQTLKSQGISSSKFHLVVESINRTTRKFPLDSAVAKYDLSSLDSSLILHSGGNLGLGNLGNTCYMNSALQCLVHLPEINYYFFFDLYERELNKTNPLGNKGEVAIAFSNLLHKLFDSQTTSTSYVTPREFKYTIGRHSSMFHGYQQQDSQEFLSWLLDALHEDLNRIYDKPYLEKPELKDEDVGNPIAISELANTCWSQHKQRNDSIIVDLFTGLYQSTLICPDCSKQSITFDPFNDLTLPLPVNKKWYHVFTIVDLSSNSQRAPISELEVELTKASNFEDLVNHLSEFLQVPVAHLFFFEIFRNYFYKDFQDNGSANKFLPVSELIGQDDTIMVYIIPHDPAKDLIVPLVNIVRDEDKSYNFSEPFGIPLFVVVDKNSETSSFGSIRRKIEQTVKILSNSDIEARFEALKGDATKTYYSIEDFPLLKNSTLREDAVMVDINQNSENVDSDGYDSDVSLANPNISASLGFEIKIYEEKPQSRSSLNSFGSRTYVTSQSSNSCLKIPRTRPQFGSLPLLASKLPELKHNYYHYPEYAEKASAKERSNNSKKTSDIESVVSGSPLSSEAEKSSFVMVDREVAVSDGGEIQAEEKKINETETLPSILDDEDLESDTNWDNVNPLFASVDNFGGPPKSSNEMEAIVSEIPSSTDDLFAKSSNKSPLLVSDKSMLVIEWNPSIHAQFFSEDEHQTWKHPATIFNPRLEESKRLLDKQQRSTISLYDCFKNFSTPEVLGEQDLWYCPRCRDHKRATKTIQLWSTGDLLTVHLKRFQSARHFSDKIDMVVDFPIEGLDMSEFVSSNSSKGEALIYDLVAVDEHYGGLGGGHYTASAKNFRDEKWYKFNDGRVTVINDPLECVTGAAYLLFYKKRTSSAFAGGNGVETLLNNGQSEFEARINNLKKQSHRILEEIEAFNSQFQVAEEEKKPASTESFLVAGNRESDEDEDLYADSDLNDQPEIPSLGSSTSTKKSRSPVAEQSMKFEFENQRKQRLISKGSDSPRSVNINMGYSSSVSNLASPAESVDYEDAI
ncbi:hypothetical protein JCM33374_g817 [Metschnikowia sp. JCM 33374]|nr:hypothetical protein JCM33374_g817 [Metschnikowia sp. JCM 33374]